MEKHYTEKIKDEKDTNEKKFKKKKSVNWDAKSQDNKENNKKETEKTEQPGQNEKEYLEIEVINKDGNTFKERVKYETKESKEFVKKREEKTHDEYTKAKELTSVARFAARGTTCPSSSSPRAKRRRTRSSALRSARTTISPSPFPCGS